MPCTPIERCRFLEDHVGPTCIWPKWLHDHVTADHLDDADFFALGRTRLGNGLSPRHFAAFSIGAGFVRDRRTQHKARHLLARFRGGELREYYDLSLQQVLPVRSPPQEQEHWKPAFALLAVPIAVPPEQAPRAGRVCSMDILTPAQRRRAHESKQEALARRAAHRRPVCGFLEPYCVMRRDKELIRHAVSNSLPAATASGRCAALAGATCGVSTCIVSK